MSFLFIPRKRKASNKEMPLNIMSGCFVLMALLPLAVLSMCPANGNTHVLYVSTNMGRNIASFDTTGRFLGNALNMSSFPPDYQIDKLRAMVFGPDGNLYVASARGAYSKIFAVSGNGIMNHTLNRDCTRQFLFEVTAISVENPYLDHPYAFFFHPEDQSIYVSNQNSATVTRYLKNRVPPSRIPVHPTWRPAPVSSFMMANLAPEAPQPTMNSGLLVGQGNTKYTLRSVRGIALSPLLSRREVEGTENVEGPTRRFYLLVCDLVGNNIAVFDSADGSYVFSIPVRAPVQVAFSHSAFANVATRSATSPTSEVPAIYVTSKDDGMLYKIPFKITGERHTTELTQKTPGRSLSGITENVGHGVLYVGDRNFRKISVYSTPLVVGYRKNERAADEPVEGTDFLGYFHVDMPDQPEFLLLTQVELQKNLPKCFEISPDGSLRYAALCLAMNIWIAVIVLLIIAMGFLFVRNVIRKQMDSEIAEKQRRAKIFHQLEADH